MYTFIINPASRSGLGGQVWSRLEPVLKDNHIPYRAWQTGYQRHATRLARELTADGKEHTIIVLGGDGTVNEVVDGIRDLDRVILGYNLFIAGSFRIAFGIAMYFASGAFGFRIFFRCGRGLFFRF